MHAAPHSEGFINEEWGTVTMYTLEEVDLLPEFPIFL
jgi:hypothetical protein